MDSKAFDELFTTRTFPLMNPYAGQFKMRYVEFLCLLTIAFNDRDAILCLRENCWATEGKLEMIRCWESYEYRRELAVRMIEKGVVFSFNPDDYFPSMNKPRLTRKFLNTIPEYITSQDTETQRITLQPE